MHRGVWCVALVAGSIGKAGAERKSLDEFLHGRISDDQSLIGSILEQLTLSSLSQTPAPPSGDKPEAGSNGAGAKDDAKTTDGKDEEPPGDFIQWQHHCRMAKKFTAEIPQGKKPVSRDEMSKVFADPDGHELSETQHMFLLDMAILSDLFDFSLLDSKKVGDWWLRRSYEYGYDAAKKRFVPGIENSCSEWSHLVSLYQNSEKKCAIVFAGTEQNPQDDWKEKLQNISGVDDFTGSFQTPMEDSMEGRTLMGYRIHSLYFERFMAFVSGYGYRKELKQYKSPAEMLITEQDNMMNPFMFLEKLAEKPYDDFVEMIKEDCGGEAFLVGHSLGGALASIAATYATRNGHFRVSGLYTFGAPGITYYDGTEEADSLGPSPRLGNHQGDEPADRFRMGNTECFPGVRVYNEDESEAEDCGGNGNGVDAVAILGSGFTAHPRVAAVRLGNIGRDPERPSYDIETTIGTCDGARAVQEPFTALHLQPSMNLTSMVEAYIPRLGKLTSLCSKCHIKTGKQCRRPKPLFEGCADSGPGAPLMCDGDAFCNAISMCECRDKCVMNGVCADDPTRDEMCRFLMEDKEGYYF